MTDTNHVVINGAPRVSATESFSQVWALTRAMKKAGWRHAASSDGTTKTVSFDPEDDRWASTFGVIGPVTNAGDSNANIATAVNGRSLVTGLSGLVTTAYSNDKGRFLIDVSTGSAHQILKVVDATSCYVDSSDNPVTPGSGVTWEIRDPAQDTYAGHLAGTQAWICLIGPMVLKIPITAGAAEGLLINEDVVQAATGARAKVLSVAADGTYITLFPRVKGTGAQYGGFDGSLFSGDVSGVEITPSATLRAMQVEMVFAKGNTDENEGGIWGMAVSLPDDTDALSTLASSAGCTAIVAPGSGGTGNDYPAHAFGIIGTPSDTTTYGGDFVYQATDLQPALIGCADCIPDANVVADGSWWISFRKNGDYTTTDFPQTMSFQFCVSGPGDLFPYMVMTHGGFSANFLTRTGPGPALANGASTPRSSGTWHNFDTTEESYNGELITTASATGGVRAPNLIAGQYMRMQLVQFSSAGNDFLWTDAGGTQRFYNEPKVPLRWCYAAGYYIYESLSISEDDKFINLVEVLYLGPWDGSEVAAS